MTAPAFPSWLPLAGERVWRTMTLSMAREIIEARDNYKPDMVEVAAEYILLSPESKSTDIWNAEEALEAVEAERKAAEPDTATRAIHDAAAAFCGQRRSG